MNTLARSDMVVDIFNSPKRNLIAPGSRAGVLSRPVVLLGFNLNCEIHKVFNWLTENSFNYKNACTLTLQLQLGLVGFLANHFKFALKKYVY